MLQIYRPSIPNRWAWISLQGPDAQDFLHRLTTLHVKAMRPGHGSAGFFLSAQGKVKSYFHLWMINPEEFFFELDPGTSGKWKAELLSVIEQFHFSEKFTVNDGTGEATSCVWLLADSEAELPQTVRQLPPKQWKEDSGLRFFNHGNRDFGRTWVGVWGTAERLESWVSALNAGTVSEEVLETMRISAGRPRIDSEISENTIPLEVGLGLHDAIDENKGCYPGQEVIERIISLGSPAKRLTRIDGSGTSPKTGDAVRSADSAQEIGTVTSVTRTATGFHALALIKKIHAKEGTSVTFASNDGSNAKVALIAPYAD